MNEREIFVAALNIESAGGRSEFLDHACADDGAMRQRIEELLREREQLGDFLEEPPAGCRPTVGAAPVTEGPGSRLGPYKLLQRIGEGGMGVVYMAEQKEPVKRRVALKIIKPGMDTQQVIARFQAERQALAMMDHPNIARVFDAGTTESGRPFFVMELVKGLPITEYCDRNELTTRERLELFRDTCAAIQHAHQKGVIHRDIKPTNVMVTQHDGRAVPKVIDFGVSKAINQELTEKTLFTAYGQMVGTPQYMSPEQAEINGLDVDTRSDVFSLGVLLYELLTGGPPLDTQRLRSLGFAEIQRIIREEEPPKPSTRLSTLGKSLTLVARQRKVDPSRLGKLLRGDLDWIVMKALEKDRGRRYQSAGGFADDIGRFLREDAVEARPPSRVYKLRKFVWRHKGPVAAATVVALALLLGIMGTTFTMVRARRAEALAQRAAALAQQRMLEARQQKARTDEARRDADRARQGAEVSAGEARTSLKQALAARRQADALRLAAQSSAVRDENPGLALLLAVEGARRADPRGAMHNNALVAALNACRERRTFLVTDQPTDDASLNPHLSCTKAAVSHDGRKIVVVTQRLFHDGRSQTMTWQDKSARVLDLESGALLTRLILPGARVHSVEFSPDDRSILATFFGAVLVTFQDGQRAIYSDHAARLFDAGSGQEVAVLKGHADRVISACFNSDGTRILTASWDGTARVWDTTGRQLAATERQRFSITSARFSPDGASFLTVPSGGNDHSSADPADAGIRDVDPSTPLDPPIRAVDRIVRVDGILNTQSGGRHLSSDREYTAVRLWDTRSGKQLHVLGNVVDQDDGPRATGDRPVDESLSACFSPDGRQVATGGWRGTVTVWDVTTGQPARFWRIERGPGDNDRSIDSIMFGPEGDRLLLLHDDERDEPAWMIVLDAAEGRELASWSDFPAGVRRACFGPDGASVLILPGRDEYPESQLKRGAGGELVLTADEDSSVELRFVEQDAPPILLNGHLGGVTAAALTPNRSAVVTAGNDGSVRVWGIDRDHRYAIELPGHSGPVGLARFSPDDRFVMTTYGLRHNVQGARGGERLVRIWEAGTGRLLHRLSDQRLVDVPIRDELLGPVRHAQFTGDGKRLLVLSDDPFVHRGVDAETESDEFPGSLPISKLESGVDVSPNPVRVWSVETGQQLVAMDGFQAGVGHAALHPDGKRIVTVSNFQYDYVTLGQDDQVRGGGSRSPRDDWAVRVWDSGSGECKRLMPEKSSAYWAEWSPDGRRLLTIGFDAEARTRFQLWNADTMELHATLDAGGQPRSTWGEFSPDSSRVMLVSNDWRKGGSASIWRVDDGANVSTLSGHEGLVHAARFGPHGIRVVTAGADRTARVWDAESGESLYDLIGHEDQVYDASFSPDGRWIVTASGDGTARIWYGEGGDEFVTLVGHRGPVFSVGFNSDSTRVVTGSGDGTARIWPIDPLPSAIAAMPRELTPRERARFLVD